MGIDAVGDLVLTERRTNAIDRGDLGPLVRPTPIEHVLIGHPAVDDAKVIADPHSAGEHGILAVVVVSARVTGVTTHETWDRVVELPADMRASIATLEGELTAHCRKHLSARERPTRYAFATALPRTLTGMTHTRLVIEHYRAKRATEP